jgi:prepilin-type N-terminal cleavage/methylation domain-containing protein
MKRNMRAGYTFLEMTFVIAILGIVASIGSEIIARVYEQYILQRAQYKAAFKTELSALEIANRMRYAIPGTVYRIKADGSTEPFASGLTATGDTYRGLQWIAYDGESFEATPGNPGWSGFCDLTASSRNTIVSPGSNLAMAQTIINNLGGDINGSSIIFANETNTSLNHTISGIAGNTITLTASAVPRRLSEQYKLAWTSYALVALKSDGSGVICPPTDRICDLYLFYNFPPTHEAPLANASRSLLLKNISTFKFTGSENTIRFKICKDEKIGLDVNITACKEKAVF